jgi:hypothetical protein
MLVLSLFRPQATASKKISRESKYANLIELRQQRVLIEKPSEEFRMHVSPFGAMETFGPPSIAVSCWLCNSYRCLVSMFFVQRKSH